MYKVTDREGPLYTNALASNTPVYSGDGSGGGSIDTLGGVFIPRLPAVGTVVQAIPVPSPVTLKYDISQDAIGVAGNAPSSGESAAFKVNYQTDSSTTLIGTMEFPDSLSDGDKGTWNLNISNSLIIESGNEIQIVFDGTVSTSNIGGSQFRISLPLIVQ